VSREVPTDNNVSDRDIKVIALNYGFKLKEQPNGGMDLNPYVYLFARAMVKEFEQVELLKRKELSKENTHLRQQVIALKQGFRIK
jgi:hypothetical protein